MTNKRNKPKYSFTRFFFNYFDNLGTMTLINLFLCIPIAIFSGLIWLLMGLLGEVHFLILFLIIPVMAPFYAGAFTASVRITRGDEVTFADFLSGMKQNYKTFLINSVIIYVIVPGLYVTFSFYRGGFGDLGVMSAFVMSLLFTLFFLFVEFGLMTMLVSVDLKLTAAIKNAVILSAGGLVENGKALASLLAVFFIVYSIITLSGSTLAAVIVFGVLTVLFLPLLLSYIIAYHVYRAVERVVINPFEKTDRPPVSRHTDDEETGEIDLAELEKLTKGDPEEYVFLKGRMIKRKTVIKMLEVHSQK